MRHQAVSNLYSNVHNQVGDKAFDVEGNPVDIDETKVAKEVKRLQADYDSKQYQRDRKLEYPTIEELVVALYDESDKASIIERRNAVKAKYPKPE